MSSPITVFPAFHDLKKKVAHEGGFSDGGVVCISKTLTPAGIDIAPAKGTALGGFSLPHGTGQVPEGIDTNPCALVMNFDPINPATVETYIVFEDGSTFLLDSSTVPAAGVLPLPVFGTIITYPNKLRIKLGTPQSGYTMPTKRVLLKGSLVEYDKPADLDAA